MNHEQLKDLLGFSNEEMTPALRRELESHLTDCAECREDRLRLARLTGALRRPEPPASEAFVQKVMARVRTKEAAPRWRRFLLPRLVPTVGLAAGTLAMLISFQRPRPNVAVEDLLGQESEGGTYVAMMLEEA